MDANVFVKYLPPEVDDDELKALFTPYGVILSARVMVNVSTGHSLGYGFVRFTTQEAARRAISEMAGYKIGNKSLLCKFSDSFAYSDPSTNLYIKPLPLGFKEEKLREMFQEFGTIIETKIMRSLAIDDSNVGFVRYANVMSATRAIHTLNNSRIDGQAHPMIVKYAESDGQRAVRKSSVYPVKTYDPPQQYAQPEYSSEVAYQSAQPTAPWMMLVQSSYYYPVYDSQQNQAYYEEYNVYYPQTQETALY